jgi:hypothetical protein
VYLVARLYLVTRSLPTPRRNRATGVLSLTTQHLIDRHGDVLLPPT